MKKQHSRAPQQVRVIAGQWKRTPLPVVDVPGLRPTPDRVRETLFNWLEHLFERDWSGKRCLDLFSGSGALGFEAASRGAQGVTLVEAASSAAWQLSAVAAKLKAQSVRIEQVDAVAYARAQAAAGQCYDLIFLDPPYPRDLLPDILPICQSLLASGGYVYAESAYPLEALDWASSWDIVRSGKAGLVHHYILRPAMASPL